ncbi:MAG TPA: DUF4157 domain-containing protein [Chthoniobacterales bacterium]|nr:DUF4157 domain-containing protein [Chthoniobacterales bacterium]
MSERALISRVPTAPPAHAQTIRDSERKQSRSCPTASSPAYDVGHCFGNVVFGSHLAAGEGACGQGLVWNQGKDETDSEETGGEQQKTLRRHGIGQGPEAVPSIVKQVLQAPGQPLDGQTRSFMEKGFCHDFASVRVHSDSKAALSAQAISARAYTVGRDIAFGAGQYAPWTPPGKVLLAHELTHVLQQGPVSFAGEIDRLRFAKSTSHEAEANGVSTIVAGGARGGRYFGELSAAGLGQGFVLQRQPTNLGAYPENERLALVQSTVPATMIDAPFLMTVFGTAEQNGGAAMRYTPAAQTVFDPSIPAALHRGLQSTGAYLDGYTNVLPPHSTVTLVLDLTPFQGPSAMFRFSRLRHGTGQAATDILLIENVGPAPAAIAPVPVPTGTFMAGGQTFTLGPGWNDSQFARLQAALARLPAIVLTEAAGTTFSRRGTGTPAEAGNYDAPQDEIVIHTNAFPVAVTTYGGADDSIRLITHEVGHLLDLRRLELAWRTFDQGGQTARGRRTLLGARSLSGSRWSAGSTFSQTDARTAMRGTDFREAARRDGIRPGRGGADPLSGGPTSYSDTDWQELFAESFSLYVNDPNLFRLIRPNLFQFFRGRFPLPAAGPGANPQPARTP